MSLPYATALTAAILQAMKTVSRENGYYTEIGARPFVGERDVSESDTPCVVITPGSDAVAEITNYSETVEIPYKITGWLNRTEATVFDYTEDPSAEFALIDAVIADIYKAVDAANLDGAKKAMSVTLVGADRLSNKGNGKLCGAAVVYQFKICKGSPA